MATGLLITEVPSKPVWLKCHPPPQMPSSIFSNPSSSKLTWKSRSPCLTKSTNSSIRLMPTAILQPSLWSLSWMYWISSWPNTFESSSIAATCLGCVRRSTWMTLLNALSKSASCNKCSLEVVARTRRRRS